MALLDVKSLEAEISRNELAETLIGLGNAMNNYGNTILLEDATLEDFFNAFPEGNRKLGSMYFFVQRRINPKGRVGIRYHFPSTENSVGIISSSTDVVVSVVFKFHVSDQLLLPALFFA